MLDKPLVWLHGEVKTPPFSAEARIRVGFLLREIQSDVMLSMPDSRQMPSIGRHCHELRIVDSETDKTWRIVYRIDRDAIVIAEVFAKKTQKTPQKVIDVCKKRFKDYDRITQE
ncbi:type II toxin-antitoxin system RelE/ParE family toxin [bacterium]|nr:type II toxin-antitoxin system RelE/ParE family toxin [bacterium]